MDLCLNTDSLAALTLEEALEFAAGLGIQSVEIAAGGQSSAPHMQPGDLLKSAGARAAFTEAIGSRGLRLAAINCSAWPLHPIRGDEQVRVIQNAITLANQLGAGKIVSMSGCPGDSPQARAINWIWFPWPPEMLKIREHQWDQALEVWGRLADFARASGVDRIALELHPLQLVYNVPTLVRLRQAIGPVIGANIDPSHMFWQQMDPVQVVRALGPAVHHVHLKDTQIFDDQVALHGVLDPRPWDDPSNRSWVFRTVGEGQPATFWSAFLKALTDIGYDDAVSIENEDPQLPGELGVKRAVDFVASVMPELVSSAETRRAERAAN